MSRIEEIEARLAATMEDTATETFSPEIVADFVSNAPGDIAYLLERVREADSAFQDAIADRNRLLADAAEGRRLVREWDDTDAYEAMVAWATKP